MNNVSEIRKARKMTQAALETLSCGILNQHRISDIERGARPTADEVVALVCLLGLPKEFLFPEKVDLSYGLSRKPKAYGPPMPPKAEN